MQNEMRVTKRNQPHGNVNRLITPEVRPQIHQLKDRLDKCNDDLSWHLSFFDLIREALDTARQSTRCLLAKYPFEAWDKIAKRRRQEIDPLRPKSGAEKQGAKRTHQTKTNNKKRIRRQMVQQVAEAQKALDDYASRLGEFFSDLTALQSFDTAVELAEHLQFNQKLKFREPRKATRSKARGGFGPAVGLQSRRKVS
jgi:hypothetical protein